MTREDIQNFIEKKIGMYWSTNEYTDLLWFINQHSNYVIGQDEKLYMSQHGTCKRCGWGIKKCNCVVRNKLRTEQRERAGL